MKQHTIDSVKSRFVDRILVYIFLLAITLPLFTTIVNIIRNDSTPIEERQAKTPEWPTNISDALRFPGKFKWYFEKRFGLRSSLIRLHGKLKVGLLGTTSNHDVLLGQDGWLFLSGEKILDFHRGAASLTEDDLNEWVETLENERVWLAEKGIKYLVVISPDSQSIYPEFLPVRLARNHGRTPTEQLSEALATKSSVEILDLCPDLISARKSNIRMFNKTDTHWNLVGSWYGARKIMEHLDGKNHTSNIKTSPGHIEMTIADGGDLARMLGLSKDLHEQVLSPELNGMHSYDESGVPTVWDSLDITFRSEVITLGQKSGQNAVLFRDSFGEALIPWLGPYFKRAVWRWSYNFDRKLIERENPDIVIRQIVERKLATVRPDGSNVESN